jgi:hypothetical protein
MLIRHYIILILRVDGLQVRRDVDVICGELVFAEVLEQVGVAGGLHVDVGVCCVFVLQCGLVLV